MDENHIIKKPPLGVMPRNIWLERRIDELQRALVARFDYSLTVSTVEGFLRLQRVMGEAGIPTENLRKAFTNQRELMTGEVTTEWAISGEISLNDTRYLPEEKKDEPPARMKRIVRILGDGAKEAER